MITLPLNLQSNLQSYVVYKNKIVWYSFVMKNKDNNKQRLEYFNWRLDLMQVPLLVVALLCVIGLVVLLAIDSHSDISRTIAYVILLVLCLVVSVLLALRIARTVKRKKAQKADKHEDKPYERK